MSKLQDIPRLVAGDSEKDQEFRAGTIAIRTNALVIGNSVYQISNLSSLHMVDLSRTKPVPAYFWVLLVAGILLLFSPKIGVLLGIGLLIAAAVVFYLYWQGKTVERFALSILMNAGNSLSLFSDDPEFLKQMAIALFKIIDREEVKSWTFNLDNRTIMDNLSGSVVNLGSVDGDIVNHV